MKLELRKFTKFVDKTFIEVKKKLKNQFYLFQLQLFLKIHGMEKGLWRI